MASRACRVPFGRTTQRPSPPAQPGGQFLPARWVATDLPERRGFWRFEPMLRGERLPDEPEAVDPKLERVPGEIADEDYGKRDYDGGGTKKENVPDAMPGYALPFRDC